MKPLLRAGAFMACIGNHEDELDGTEFTDYYARLFPFAGSRRDAVVLPLFVRLACTSSRSIPRLARHQLGAIPVVRA